MTPLKLEATKEGTMVSATTAKFDQVLQEILYTAVDKPQVPQLEKANVRTIERMVHQCHALLRQNLERKVKMEPNVYHKERVERILDQFEAVMPDIQEAIAARVLDSISEIIRLEISRVLQDALSDLQDANVEPVSDKGEDEAQPSNNAASLQGPEPSRLTTEENVSSTAQTERATGLQRQIDRHQEPAAQRTSKPESRLTADKPEHQQVDGSSGASEMARKPDETADDEVFHGDVKVGLESHQSPKHMIRFLNQIEGNSQLRMLRMIGNNHGATLWLALRQPLRLNKLFSEMDNVSEVRVCRPRGSGGPEQVLEVVLGGL